MRDFEEFAVLHNQSGTLVRYARMRLAQNQKWLLPYRHFYWMMSLRSERFGIKRSGKVAVQECTDVHDCTDNAAGAS